MFNMWLTANLSLVSYSFNSKNIKKTFFFHFFLAKQQRSSLFGTAPNTLLMSRLINFMIIKRFYSSAHWMRSGCSSNSSFTGGSFFLIRYTCKTNLSTVSEVCVCVCGHRRGRVRDRPYLFHILKMAQVQAIWAAYAHTHMHTQMQAHWNNMFKLHSTWLLSSMSHILAFSPTCITFWCSL